MSFAAFALYSLAFSQSAGEKLAAAEQTRLEECVAKIETDPEEAYEDGLAWTYAGNRPGARQCTALALIALDQPEEGATRLQQLANSSDGGTMEQRAIYLTQAGHAWIQADAPDSAVVSFTNALKLLPGTTDVLIDRAAAYLLLDEHKKAIADLDRALANAPGRGDAYQLRAEALLLKGDLDKAMLDVEAAMDADPKNIDTLVLRGRVREAMRVREDEGPIERVSDN